MARGKRGPKSGPMRLYKSYMFTNKDPVIDEMRTLMQDEFGRGKISNKALESVEEMGGPTPGTIRNWFYGDTKRPQNASIEAAGRAIGMKRVWIRSNPKNNGDKK
jgi:hypothetical protein